MKRLMTRLQFLLEAHFYLDEELNDTFTSIDNPIAKRILDLHRKQQDSDLSFVTHANQKGYISFATYKKAAEILRKNDDPFAKNIPDEVATDKKLDVHDRNKAFDYLRGNKSMTSAKITRLVSTLFPNEYKDAEGQKTLRDLIDKYGALTDNSYTLDVVSGEEIRHWYLLDNYESNKGDLGGSCMRYDYCQSYLDIYTENPEVVSMLIMKNSKQQLRGRALIWNLNQEGGPKQLMDRIYFRDERVKETFINWAKDKKMAYKASRGNNIVWNGERYEETELKVQLDEWEFDKYPYMDTFCKLDTGTGELTIDTTKQEGFYILNSTDGEYEEPNLVWSEWEDRELDEDDATYSEEVGWISRDNAVDIYYSRGHSTWPKNHPDIVKIEDEGYFHIEDTAFSDHMQKHILYSDAIQVVGSIYQISADYISVETDYVDGTIELVKWEDMECSEWLKHLSENDDWDEMPFCKEDTTEAGGGKILLTDWMLDVFETNEGQLSKPHCDIFGIDTEGLKKSQTDEPSYNWNMKKETREKLISTLNGKDDKQVQKLTRWRH
jgi:hypothetical protein